MMTLCFTRKVYVSMGIEYAVLDDYYPRMQKKNMMTLCFTRKVYVSMGIEYAVLDDYYPRMHMATPIKFSASLFGLVACRPNKPNLVEKLSDQFHIQRLLRPTQYLALAQPPRQLSVPHTSMPMPIPMHFTTGTHSTFPSQK